MHFLQNLFKDTSCCSLSRGNCGSLGEVALQSQSILPYRAQQALQRNRGKTGRGQLMGQISKRLFWLPHTARWIWPCWDRMVETRTLMRYGSANVKKCHFWAAGTTLLKAAVVLEDMWAHTDMVPPPKAFNLSPEADWNHTANPSLISEWQALLFSSMSQKSGWLALFRWCDSDVFCSSHFRTKYPFILCQHKVSQEQLAITRSLAEKAGVPAQS